MRALVFLGKLLISIGCGVILFVVWTLWGTGLLTEREQRQLDRAYAATPAVTASPVDDAGRASVTPVEVPASFRPRPGAPAFRLRIPKIGVNEVVVEGVGTEELRKGPGHYPACGNGFEPPLCIDGVPSFWPGEAGRAIVSGHRTTYGAPFFDLDRLRRGDRVVTETKWGTFVYEVTESVVVDATEPVTVTPGDPELVLTTCNPRYSAEERLLVYTRLVSSS
jgi:sortase A